MHGMHLPQILMSTCESEPPPIYIDIEARATAKTYENNSEKTKK